jgi:phytol kinase
MTTIILTILGIAGLILGTEILWRLKILKPEIARKIVHLSVGCVIAAWPYFINYQAIQWLSIFMFVGVYLSYKYKIFGSIHSVKRSTRGELLYPISIGLCAFIEPVPWIFTAAILHLAIADGLAAMVGTKINGRTSYKILGHQKSLVGTGVFFLTSLIIISGSFVSLANYDLLGITPLTILGIALLATVIENISWYGLDNLTVPLTIVLALSLV